MAKQPGAKDSAGRTPKPVPGASSGRTPKPVAAAPSSGRTPKPVATAPTTGRTPKPVAEALPPDTLIAAPDRGRRDFAKYNAPRDRNPMLRKALFAAGWVVVVIVLGWAVYKMLPAPAGRGGERASPDAAVESYTSFVRPYIPPSSLTPTQDTVGYWLQYFDAASRDWFEQNIDGVSFLLHRGNPDEWLEMSPAKRRMEAMQFMLTRGPMRGGAVVLQQQPGNGETAQLVISDGTMQFHVLARRNGKAWEFPNFMDQIRDVNAALKGLTLPQKKG